MSTPKDTPTALALHLTETQGRHLFPQAITNQIQPLFALHRMDNDASCRTLVI